MVAMECTRATAARGALVVPVVTRRRGAPMATGALAAMAAPLEMEAMVGPVTRIPSLVETAATVEIPVRPVWGEPPAVALVLLELPALQVRMLPAGATAVRVARGIRLTAQQVAQAATVATVATAALSATAVRGASVAMLMSLVRA